jgi:hypothetical protein
MTTRKEMRALMGKRVLVFQTLERVSDGRSRYWQRTELRVRRYGWIVGFRWLLQGEVIPGTKPGWGIDSYDYGEPSSFNETGPRTPCVLVAFDPRHNFVRVPLDGYKLGNV